ncbi:MAG TPA: type II toxin-antitoxin system PemK/MazF family toxin [Longimicrobiales bacterium]|nr:type II toxin-antitoxin system PemK/MazF family toxin [Longimicrobiales bacterium]
MVVHRGEIWWADLAEPRGSEPGFRHPVLILQAEPFNRSRLRTVVGIVVSSNARLLDAPGNVLLPAKETGLPRDSVANVTQLVTVDRDYLEQRAGKVSTRTLARVEVGVRLVLDL